MKRVRVMAALLILALVTVGTHPAGVHGMAAARVLPDRTEVFWQDGQKVTISGSVTPAGSQRVVLLDENEKTILSRSTADRNGTFRLEVPVQRLLKNSAVTVYVQALPAAGLTASSRVAIRLQYQKSVAQQTEKGQTETGKTENTRTQTEARSPQLRTADTAVLTNLKPSASLTIRSNSRGNITYRSSKPAIVSVSGTGKITRKKNGTAVITVHQQAAGGFTEASRTIKVTCRKSTRREQIDGAVAWAVKIARDNRFAYGTGRGAHHNGCYFCGTNYGPRKYTKPGKRYRRTYCCNPFIHAAYAHGAGHPKMLAGCRKASGIGMKKSTFYQFGCWKCVGKPSYRKLQKGDVLVKSNHVAMYIGGKKLVEASGGTWSASSIAVKKMSKKRYRQFSFVMRYTGY